MSGLIADARCLSRVVLTVTFLSAIMTVKSASQVIDPATAQRQPIPNAGHDYIGMGSEIVSPVDGSVSFSLPISTAPGRQLSFPFSIQFHSGSLFYVTNHNASGALSWTTPKQENEPEPFSLNGWSYALPYYQAQATATSVTTAYGENYCWTTNNYTFMGFQNVLYPIGMSNQWPDPNNSQQTNICSQTSYPSGGSGPLGLTGTLNAPPQGTLGVQPPIDIVDKSGLKYSFPTGPGISTNPAVVAGGFTPFGVLAQSITDRNGNQITLQGTSVYPERFTLASGSYTDTVGRSVVA